VLKNNHHTNSMSQSSSRARKSNHHSSAQAHGFLLPIPSAASHATAIFQKGSTTYFTASLFFSRELRQKVTTLYAFVRVVDDFVDAQPQQKKEFEEFYAEYRRCKTGATSKISVISEFIALERSASFEPAWVEAFFTAMRADLTKKTYRTMEELDAYMYGSAEVIGLMMARLMKLPKQADTTARLLGKAMQYCNFLRDVQEDTELGRTYIPETVLHKYGIQEVTAEASHNQPDKFTAMMRSQSALCLEWMNEALLGTRFIPWRERIAILTAADMYSWTLHMIAKNPMEVFSRKIKPSKPYIMLAAFKNIIHGS
jgi:phytoene synthase